MKILNILYNASLGVSILAIVFSAVVICSSIIVPVYYLIYY